MLEEELPPPDPSPRPAAQLRARGVHREEPTPAGPPPAKPQALLSASLCSPRAPGPDPSYPRQESRGGCRPCSASAPFAIRRFSMLKTLIKLIRVRCA